MFLSKVCRPTLAPFKAQPICTGSKANRLRPSGTVGKNGGATCVHSSIGLHDVVSKFKKITFTAQKQLNGNPRMQSAVWFFYDCILMLELSLKILIFAHF
jgi:hypothetical protein